MIAARLTAAAAADLVLAITPGFGDPHLADFFNNTGDTIGLASRTGFRTRRRPFGWCSPT